jgi:hypothetical protein
MSNENHAKQIISTILINALWVIPLGLMLFARLFPDQFDRVWKKFFGE